MNYNFNKKKLILKIKHLQQKINEINYNVQIYKDKISHLQKSNLDLEKKLEKKNIQSDIQSDIFSKLSEIQDENRNNNIEIKQFIKSELYIIKNEMINKNNSYENTIKNIIKNNDKLKNQILDIKYTIPKLLSI